MVKKATSLVGIGILLYSYSLFNGFVWDDEVSFGARSELTQAYFRPVMSFLYSIIYSLVGSTPLFFHLASVIFHITTAILLLYLFRQFFSEKKSFILSLFFLVHPAIVEAVCFASALQEVLFTFIGTLGLYFIVRDEAYSPVEASAKSGLVSTIFLGLFCFTLALLMKETGMVFFVLGFTYLMIFHRKNGQALQLYGAFTCILIFGYGLLRMESGNIYSQGEGLFPIMRVPINIRLINIPMITLFYIKTFFFPFYLEIAQQWVVRTMNLWQFWVPLGLLIGMLCGNFNYILFLKRNDTKKYNLYVFFFFWFLIGLLPHLQLIPLNMTVAERWMYFPIVGLLGMTGVLTESLKLKAQSSKLVLGIGLILFIFFVRSFIRTLDWQTGLKLYGSNISDSSSFDLQNNMGVELFRAGEQRKAKAYFEKSVQLAPYWWINWNNLGAAYEHEGNSIRAQECYEQSIKNGDYVLAYENLARILVLYGKDTRKTSEFLDAASSLFPGSTMLQSIKSSLKDKHN